MNALTTQIAETNLKTTLVIMRASIGRITFLAVSRSLGMLAAGVIIANFAIVLFTMIAGIILSVANPPTTSLELHRLIVDHYREEPVTFVPIAKIPVRIQRMFVRVEDSTFYRHRGIELSAIEHAYRVNRAAGEIVLGGSTITQQLVRTLFLSNRKDYVRKYTEALMAVSLNSVMAKQRQLELYLNYIEWGKGIYGIGAASRYYYGKPLSKIDLDQAIRLAVVITSPLLYNVFTFGKNAGMVERYGCLWSSR